MPSSKRKMVDVECFGCGKMHSKAKSEVKRNRKKRRNNFCSIGCFRSWRNRNYPDEVKNRYDISKHAANLKDDCTNFRYYLKNARARKHEVDIDCDHLKEVWDYQKGKCVHTGIPLILKTHMTWDVDYGFNQASLDRIDSAKGYVIGNVQFASLAINLAKSNKDDKYIKDFIKQIVQNYEEE